MGADNPFDPGTAENPASQSSWLGEVFLLVVIVLGMAMLCLGLQGGRGLFTTLAIPVLAGLVYGYLRHGARPPILILAPAGGLAFGLLFAALVGLEENAVGTMAEVGTGVFAGTVLLVFSGLTVAGTLLVGLGVLFGTVLPVDLGGS